jgi:hypothetical protein
MSVSVAEKLAVPGVQAPQAPLSVALRNISITVGLTILSLAIAGFLWREQGYEMLIVTMGWPHVLLGFVFYFGRVLRGEAKARSAFVFLALLTLAIWIIHYNYAITGLIYLYFLYHAFRDEIFVYLQTRARHRPGPGVYAVAGAGPLILLMLLVPKQQDFRQDLRRVELTGTQVAAAGWTLTSFKPVQNSMGRDFYFYVQAPHTERLRAFVTRATIDDTRRDGEVLVGDHQWTQAKDLSFRPHYAGDSESVLNEMASAPNEIPVLLTGGHKVGQTFRAERNNLDGIWLPVDRLEQTAEPVQFVFHLAFPPLLPYSRLLSDLRITLLVILSGLVLWRLIPGNGGTSQLWIYLLVLVTAFAGTQMILKSSSNAGYPFPLIFQFVVVFHYWSWYVFSFDKLSTSASKRVKTSIGVGLYDRMLDYLRRRPYFTAAVIGLNLISAVGVFWYYKLNGPNPLRFAFDYSYFLYFLVFHVTFSFSPKPRNRVALTESRALAT